MADATTLDTLINNLAQEAKSFDENISQLFALTQNLIGANIPIEPAASILPTDSTPPQGKLPLLSKYIADITSKNAQLVEITAKLSETL